MILKNSTPLPDPGRPSPFPILFPDIEFRRRRFKISNFFKLSEFCGNPVDYRRGRGSGVWGGVGRGLISASCVPSALPRSGELRTLKLKSHLVRTQSLNVLPLKPGVSQYLAIHATLTAKNFFLAYFYPSSPFTCIFPKPLPIFLLRWLWLTSVPV